MVVAAAPLVDRNPAAPRRTPLPAVPGPGLDLDPQRTSIRIVPWASLGVAEAPDGHDPRSSYVERFWLGILGPSTTWLLRAIAYGFDGEPDGFDLDILDTARVLGLGERWGRQSPFVRSLGRLCTFELALPLGDDALAVRRAVPWLHRRQVLRLPVVLRDEHAAWESSRTPATPAAAPAAAPATPAGTDGVEAMRRRAAQLAASLAQLGESEDAIEQTLLRWRFHPAIAGQYARWAIERAGGGQ